MRASYFRFGVDVNSKRSVWCCAPILLQIQYSPVDQVMEKRMLGSHAGAV